MGNRHKLGIIFTYAAAVFIMASIVFLFGIVPFRFPYSTAAFGFLLYVSGVFLTREGRFTPYKFGMIGVAILLIVLSIVREVLRLR